MRLQSPPERMSPISLSSSIVAAVEGSSAPWRRKNSQAHGLGVLFGALGGKTAIGQQLPRVGAKVNVSYVNLSICDTIDQKQVIIQSIDLPRHLSLIDQVSQIRWTILQPHQQAIGRLSHWLCPCRTTQLTGQTKGTAWS
ncbi:uncharacterized protein G2W53_040805 [Senna tora]|uniref:Uncharacterized protein n=1 Tax=Senna tora TaxID=362788 RepID=A0A834W2C0_9FABA|nr:uncharacterized protein G2W53_040805 [Senna tora]